jgi:putative ABC transport system substrate-binding protein
MRFKTVSGVVMLALVMLTTLCTANAQPSTTVYRIGVLWPGRPPASPGPGVKAFEQRLRDLGYFEGQNLAIEHRYAESNDARLADLAAELVRLPVDVIMTSGTRATRAAQHATSTIPIVMTAVGVDPVAFGLVASLARPEGNITGVITVNFELLEKKLALLKEAVPRLARLALLWNPENPTHATSLREVTTITRALGVQLHPLEVRHASAFAPAFAAIAQEPPDALVVFWDALTGAHAHTIADFAVRHRLPTLAPNKAYVQAGALLSYGTSLPGQMRRAATYVDKILKGTKPADLPVERPMEFELVINLKTAQAIGLTLPPMLLFQATEVIR